MSVQRETMSRAFFYVLLLAVSGYSFGGPANLTCSVSCAYRSDLAQSLAFWGTLAANIGTGSFVLIYWLYTLKEKNSLQVWLKSPRALWFSLPMGIFPLVAFWLHEGLFGSLNLLVFLCLDLYAYRRQWVDGHPARLAKESHNFELLSDEAPIVVATDGRALSLAELEHNKLMVVPGSPRLLFVHCRLSRSLNVFSISEDMRFRAKLPHQTGFIIHCDNTKRSWDGVDGRSLGTHEDLPPFGLSIISQSKTNKHENLKLFLLDPKEANRKIVACSPQLPSAQIIDNPMDLGVVEHNEWHLNAENADETSYYISRWAAHHRGVGIPPELI